MRAAVDYMLVVHVLSIGLGISAQARTAFITQGKAYAYYWIIFWIIMGEQTQHTQHTRGHEATSHPNTYEATRARWMLYYTR